MRQGPPRLRRWTSRENRPGNGKIRAQEGLGNKGSGSGWLPSSAMTLRVSFACGIACSLNDDDPGCLDEHELTEPKIGAVGLSGVDRV